MVGIAGMVELFGDEYVDYSNSVNREYCSSCPGVPPACPLTCVERPVVKKGSIIQLLMTLAFCTAPDGSDPGLADQH